MNNKRMPSKLQVEPVVSAVFEIRLSTSKPMHQSVPPMMFTRFASEIQGIQALPGGIILQETPGPDISPYVQKLRLDWRDFHILLGDQVVLVTYEGAYPGGDLFKRVIHDVVDAVLDAGLAVAIERYSVKYTNFFPFDAEHPFSEDLDLKVSLGGADIGDANSLLRVETEDGLFRTITSILTRAQLQQPSSTTPRSGGVIEIDEICLYATADLTLFRSELLSRLDELRIRNKQAFFNALKQTAIDRLGPTYDKQNSQLH